MNSIKSKRNLSEKQENWLVFINRRIINKIVVQHLPDEMEVNQNECEENDMALSQREGEEEEEENDDYYDDDFDE